MIVKKKVHVQLSHGLFISYSASQAQTDETVQLLCERMSLKFLTSPVASATKFSAVLGTVFPSTPMTILPASSSPILMSK